LVRLLQALDNDQEVAGQKYIALRSRLTDWFSWRSCEEPGDLADETLNRVARKLSEGQAIQDPGSYALGIARMIVHESRRAQRDKMAIIGELKMIGGQAAQEPPGLAGDADMIEKVNRCLASLPAENRRLIERYYDEDLEALAREAGISVNALRNRAMRIRKKLFDCVSESRDAE
jgi:DNA-directed RNA polymerase specialized sigma24 family protein